MLFRHARARSASSRKMSRASTLGASGKRKSWMAGTSPAKTCQRVLTRTSPRHQGGGEEREHHLATLIGAGIARLQDAPFGALLRRPLGFDLVGKADGVAGQNRLDPAQFAKARRRPPHRDLLATRDRFRRQALAVCDQELHANRGDVPARCSQSPEQGFASLLLIEVKALRVELRGKPLNVVGGEGERAEVAPGADLDILEETHRYIAPASSRRRTMIGDSISHSTMPAALRIVPLKVTMPVSGRLFETLASATSTSSVKSSPGRSGAIQRISLTPGEPSEAVRPMKPSNSIRIMIEPRCQPEPDSPFSIDALAAASSRCIGCGSNSAAKARISSRVTWRGPNVPKWPGGKSSKVNVVIYLRFGLRITAGKPECGRYLRQSQPVHPHGLFARGEYRSRRSPLTCPKQFSGLALCPSGTRFLTRRRTIDARFSGSVSVGPLHHAHDHQDLLLAGHRLDRAVRPVRDLLGACRDGDQPVRRIHPTVVLDRRCRGRRGVFAHRRGIHLDRLPNQRASRRDPRPGADAVISPAP